MAKRRPLINTEPVSEFGASHEDDIGDTRPVDLLQVPGFSELRYQRDVEMAEYKAGTRRGQDVSVLPVNCRWVGITRGAKDEPSSIKLMRAANDGYQPVKAEMIGKHPWLTAMPPGSRKLADGSIVNAAGDLQLHWAPAATAARNQRRKARQAMLQVDNLGNGAEGFKAVASNVAGLTDIAVERTTG